ncbi:hypothetical protein M408DRAFT_174809 [Serendipita vermifera MAFF 305830]|uniref:Peptidase C14 caspase domain-containing protein n=1 Tax=Serendipita vermifera MAFF 305830 TaxID=933852 RepID=A0A0C3AQP8_SERVB|nr:hypothetical protein M408DRAFT_174809 [Serendipita vermifera MAFF 305830]
MLNPSSSAGKDIATSDQVGALVSEDPQPQLVDNFEFELKGPSDSKEEIVDEEDDLATPLEPLTKDFIHQNFPAPDILDIDPNDFDTEAAIKKYNYNFDDSAEVPKRRALLVGIKGDALKGSHNDVEDMRALLMDVYHWKDEEIMVLKDDDPKSPFYPVRQTVVDHLFILVHNARDGDRLFIHFSGHGSQIEDEDGDETDGLDEVICCADGEIIVDDQLHDILVKPLPHGCRLTALFDCCASGKHLPILQPYLTPPIRNWPR